MSEIILGSSILENKLAKSALKFEADNPFYIYIDTRRWPGRLECSIDGIDWTEDIKPSTQNSTVVYVRGTDNTFINSIFSFRSSSESKPITYVKCTGNIETLLDYETVLAGNHPTMAENCFSRLFDGCTLLTQAPELLATTLAKNCYDWMFCGCTSLTQAPELPATTLAESCYSYMFYGCTSLVEAPELPATTLAEDCYSSMFYGCTSLTHAPALPATELVYGCYEYMFQNCTSLTQAPELSAAILAKYCCSYMFYNCTSLVQAPKLPATTLADYCYQGMFQGCTSLNTLPKLPALTLISNCYQDMFKGCTSVKISQWPSSEYQTAYSIPITGHGTSQSYWNMADMFSNTGGTFTGTPEINRTYYTSNTII